MLPSPCGLWLTVVCAGSLGPPTCRRKAGPVLKVVVPAGLTYALDLVVPKRRRMAFKLAVTATGLAKLLQGKKSNSQEPVALQVASKYLGRAHHT